MLHRETLPSSTLDLLITLCAHPALQGFALAGGTSLALRFGHRISVDFDFFTRTPFDNEDLVQALKQDFSIDERRRGSTGITAFIDGVKVDLVKYPYPPLHPIEFIEGVRLMGLRDVAAMKLSAVTNRGAKKDFYDLHELLLRMGLQELLDCYVAKFPGTDPLMLLRSLTCFVDAEEGEHPESLHALDWPQIKLGIMTAVKGFL